VRFSAGAEMAFARALHGRCESPAARPHRPEETRRLMTRYTVTPPAARSLAPDLCFPLVKPPAARSNRPGRPHSLRYLSEESHPRGRDGARGNTLLLHQLHAAVLGAAVLAVIRRYGRVRAATVGLQPCGWNRVLRRERGEHRLCAS